MSEYQYYEFQAIDRPLTADQQAKVAALSSRAHVTAHVASFVYNYGDFRGDPEQLLRDYFDAMLYMANWGARRLMFRIPCALMDTKRVKLYCISEDIELRQTPNKQHVIVDLEFNDEEQAEWTEGEGWLDALTALREELIQGDLRVLYLAWLKAAEVAVEREDIVEDTLEPPVPAGLGQLSPALETFVRFVDVDEALLAVAAQHSGNRRQEAPQLEPWITQLPAAEQYDFLVRLNRGEPNLSLLLRRRLQELATGTLPHEQEAETERRTIAALREAAVVWRQQKQAAAQRHAALTRQRHLEALAVREPQAWQEVEALIEEKKATAYASAVALLEDLSDLATSRGEAACFQQRMADIERTYSNRSALLRRMRQSRLI
jgi:hypothetical protein